LLRKAHPTLRRARYLTGAAAGGAAPDIVWLTPKGVPKTEEDWRYPDAHVLAFVLNGDDDGTNGPGADAPDAQARAGDPAGPAATPRPSLLFLLNSHTDAMDFVIPQGTAAHWTVTIDTAADDGRGPARTLAAGATCRVPARTTVVLAGATGALPEAPAGRDAAGPA
jgi:pullulanase/glycogen debranching enzyme